MCGPLDLWWNVSSLCLSVLIQIIGGTSRHTHTDRQTDRRTDCHSITVLHMASHSETVQGAIPYLNHESLKTWYFWQFWGHLKVRDLSLLSRLDCRLHGTKTYAVVTCERKLFWNNFEIVSAFYFTSNHRPWLHAKQNTEIISKLFQNNFASHVTTSEIISKSTAKITSK